MQPEMTDKEQIEQVKQWMKEYGWAILIAVVIGLGGSYGWRTWKGRQQSKKAEASDLYAAMQVMADEKNQSKLNDYANQLVSKHPKSVYASLGKLLQAQQQANAHQYTDAVTSINWVINYADPSVVKDMAYFSMSAVDMQQKKDQQALAELDKVSATFAPVVWQQKAMVYQQMNDSAKAVAALNKSKQLYTKDKLSNPLLDILLAQYPIKK